MTSTLRSVFQRPELYVVIVVAGILRILIYPGTAGSIVYVGLAAATFGLMATLAARAKSAQSGTGATSPILDATLNDREGTTLSAGGTVMALATGMGLGLLALFATGPVGIVVGAAATLIAGGAIFVSPLASRLTRSVPGVQRWTVLVILSAATFVTLLILTPLIPRT